MRTHTTCCSKCHMIDAKLHQPQHTHTHTTLDTTLAKHQEVSLCIHILIQQSAQVSCSMIHNLEGEARISLTHKHLFTFVMHSR